MVLLRGLRPAADTVSAGKKTIKQIKQKNNKERLSVYSGSGPALPETAAEGCVAARCKLAQKVSPLTGGIEVT